MNAIQVEAHLMEVESSGGWFAGTGEDRPTSADFVMALTLQILVVYASDYRGPKTREYIKKVQARPAYKRVSRFEWATELLDALLTSLKIGTRERRGRLRIRIQGLDRVLKVLPARRGWL